MDANVEQNVVIAQPRTLQERRDVATRCCARIRLTMPCVVDTLDNAVDELYAAWPERMFVITAEGRIGYAGEPGPWGFKPEAVEAWLKANVR